MHEHGELILAGQLELPGTWSRSVLGATNYCLGLSCSFMNG